MYKKLYRYICLFISFVLFLEFIPKAPVYAASDMPDFSVTEEITDSEHTETTAESYNELVPDSVTSIPALTADLPALPENESKKEAPQITENIITIDDFTTSGSAFDFKMNLNMMSDKTAAIISGSKKYSSLSREQRDLLLDEASLREDTMLECEAAGLSIEQSAPKAIIMQRMNISLTDAINMINKYGSETEALEETGKFKADEFAAPILSNKKIKPQIAYYMANGNTADEAIDAYIASKLINSDVVSTISGIDDYTTSDSALKILDVSAIKDEIYDAENTGSDDYSYNEAFDEPFAEQKDIGEYLNTNNIDNAEFEKIVYKVKSEMGLMESDIAEENDVSALSPDYGGSLTLNDAQFKTGPNINTNSINDSVNVNTGELTVENTICSIKGLNGLDLNLCLVYKSNSRLSRKIEKDRFNVGENWSLSFPYLLDREYTSLDSGKGMRYVVTPEGSAYERGNVKNFTGLYGERIARFSLPLSYSSYKYITMDYNNSLNANSSYYLEHIDGTKYYFDGIGRWIATRNRFGNTILLSYSEADRKYYITDTLGNSIAISKSADSLRFTFPDQTSYTINKGSDGGQKDKTAVLSTVDRNSQITSYSYIQLENDTSGGKEYTNSLLTEIKSPTGMINKYTYETAEVESYDYLSDTKETCYYPRIASKWIEYGGKKYKEENYKYQLHSYTFANTAPRYWHTYGDGSHSAYLKFERDGNFVCADCGIPLTTLLKGSKIASLKLNRYLDAYDFQYRTVVTTENCSYSRSFDYMHRLDFESTNYNDGTQIDVDYTYEDELPNDNYRHYSIPYPKTVKTTISAPSGSSITKTEEYEYDYYGNITSYVIKDSSGNIIHEETHKYDEETNTSSDFTKDCHYWLETESTYRRSSDEIITIKNTLVTDSSGISLAFDPGDYKNKCIQQTDTYLNDELKSRTGYYYYSNYLLYGKYEWANLQTGSQQSKNTYYEYADGEEESVRNPISAQPIYVETNGTGMLGSSIVKYEYDTNGNITLMQDGNGNFTAYKYDGNGNITKETHAAKKSDLNSAKSKTYTYNYTKPSCRVTYENGTYVDYSYDAAWNLTTIHIGNDLYCSYTYDTLMRPLTYKEGGALTSYTYDDQSRMLSETVVDNDHQSNELSKKTYSYVLNSTGWCKTETIYGDANCENIVNISQNDLMDRTVMTNNAGNITNYTFDLMDNVTKSSNVISQNTTYDTCYTYDIYGNVTETVSGSGANQIKTSAQYDMLGRMTSSTDAKGYTSIYYYDCFGNMISARKPLFLDKESKIVYNVINKTYDSVDNLTGESASEGASTSYSYDFKNRLVAAVTGNEIVNYSYDDAGNLTCMSTNSGTQNYTYAYDGCNRLAKYTDALGNSETYTYDNHNNLISKTDRNGNTISYTYDPLHRKLSEASERDYRLSNTFTYGKTGVLTSATNNTGIKRYAYNSSGLVKTEETSIGIGSAGTSFKIAKTYDQRGNLTQSDYTKNGTTYQKIKYTYDERSRLTDVSVAEGTNTSFLSKAKYAYDENDNMTKITYGNGMYNDYTYNAGNLISGITLRKSGETLQSMSYTYNSAGNMSQKTETIGVQTLTANYTYDTANRLVSESVFGYTNYRYNFTYDGAGNRKTAAYYVNNAHIYTEDYTYDKNNRLTFKTKDNLQTRYFYDKNGNQTIEETYPINNEGIFKLDAVHSNNSAGVGIKRYTYNIFNQLTKYTNTAGTYNNWTGITASYTYFADGLRASKNVNGIETGYLWDGDNICAELNSNKSITERYFRGHHLISDNSNNYYFHNAHGDVIAVCNGTTPTNTYAYDAFGNSSSQMKFGYFDQQFDVETGNYYLRARYYDPTTGRFLSEDPIKDGLNWYAYCKNNPILLYDYSGLSSSFNNIKDTITNKAKHLETYYGLYYVAFSQYALIATYRHDSAYRSVSKNTETILFASQKYSVPADIIGAIIYKEQLTQSIDDSTALSLTQITGKGHSVGLGAIFPNTAIEAWNYVNNNVYENMQKDPYLLEKDLMKNTFNIETIAAVLIYYASKLKFIANESTDVSNLTEDEWTQVIGRYNAATTEKQKNYSSKVNSYRKYITNILEEYK